MATGPGLRPDIWRRFVERFGIELVIETYGQTEANVSLMNRRGPVGSVGRAAPGTHANLRVVRFDRDRQAPLRNAAGRLEECRRGEVGELISVIAQNTRMSFDGYVNSNDNEQKLLRDCFEPGDLYLRTGDLMRRDRRGYFLDPWNNPYWIQYSRKSRTGALYSFGPNRRRDAAVRKRNSDPGDDVIVRFTIPEHPANTSDDDGDASHAARF